MRWGYAHAAARRAGREALAGPTTGQATAARLAVVAVSGRLAADSSPAKNGFRSYGLRVQSISVIAPGLAGELRYRGPGQSAGAVFRVLQRGGPALVSGVTIRARGALLRPGAAITSLVARLRRPVAGR
jgi:hypothetical protein